MWCSRCEQDVPGLMSPEKREFVCIRCGGKLEPPPGFPKQGKETSFSAGEGAVCAVTPAYSTSHPSAAHSEGQPSPYPGIILPIASFLSYDDWEIEQALRRIHRHVRKDPSCPKQAETRQARLDAPHGETPPNHWTLSPSVSSSPKTGSDLKNRTGILIYGGLMSLICGTVLLVWSYLTGREELQQWGWPGLVIGQAGLLLGILLNRPSKGGDHPPQKSPVPPEKPSHSAVSWQELPDGARIETAHPFPSQPLSPFHLPRYQTG